MARVMLVDDEQQIRNMMRKMLENREHTFFEAENGVQALERYREARPDLVITDILMPEKGGLALIAEIKKINPAQRIIAISGGGKDGKLCFLSTAKAINGVTTLKKPFTMEAFQRTVDEAMGKRYENATA